MTTHLRILFSLLMLVTLQAGAQDLPRVTGLALDGDQLAWDAQDGATGYNIQLDYEYYDTVRDITEYTVTEPGKYHVISFNDNGEFGVTRNLDEIGQPYLYVEYTGDSGTVHYNVDYRVLIVTNTCIDVGPGETCIARCPRQYQHQFGTARISHLSGGACSTSDIVEADAFVSPITYSCSVPTYSGEVVAQAICVLR